MKKNQAFLVLSSVASVLFLQVAGRSPAQESQHQDHMILQDFNKSSIPGNRSGDTYPSQYPRSGTATVSLNSTDAITGNSIQIDLSSGRLHLQFNPYNADDSRGFARDYSANPSAWRFNTYNRMSFWIKRPRSAAPLDLHGRSNVELGTFVKRVANPDSRSDETGNSHYYHMLNLPNEGQWTYVIINMHPNHLRSQPGAEDPGNRPHPTGEPKFNYFDTLTRFYIEDEPTRGTYLVDDIQFYHEPAAENDRQVYSLTGTFDPVKNRLTVTWERHKNENNIAHEVRYAFKDIHQLGWEAASRAPRGIVKPPGEQGYNGMVYTAQTRPITGHPVLYIAIKPSNSRLFSQIALPLRGTVSPDAPGSRAPH
jgi:hypothetical protein